MSARTAFPFSFRKGGPFNGEQVSILEKRNI